MVLVDNLEKMQLLERESEPSHSFLFVRHAEQLKAPRCHLVYTVPVSLVFNANLGADYHVVDVIPMVKITEADGVTRSDAGRQALARLVSRRADVERLVQSTDLVLRLIETSGGVVRDLLRLVQFACVDASVQQGTAMIDTRVIDAAIRRLGVEYEYLLQESYLERLVELGRTREFPRDPLAGELLFLRLVLEYRNHESWYDLHPLIRAVPRLRRRLTDIE